MINGKLTEFLDKLYFGEELHFEYCGKEYFLQGWMEDGEAIMVLDVLEDAPFKNYIWETKDKNMKECAEEFINSPIWEGKDFMQIQREVSWKE